MNISSIQITASSDKSVYSWRFRRGAGRLQGAVAVSGNEGERELFSKGLASALLGKKSTLIDEVIVEFVDNAGDVWTVQRGPYGSQFSQNSRPISVDQAQRSMLAALLDADVGLSSQDGLVAPFVYQIIEAQQGKFFSRDGISDEHARASEPDASLVSALISEECARLLGQSEYNDPKKLALIADSLVSLQGRWAETFTLPTGTTSVGQTNHAPSLSMVENITRELDHLLQIDFLCKKMGDSHDNLARLSSQLEALDQRIQQISSAWSSEALAVGMDRERWIKGIELLVRVRGYTKLSETASRIKKISLERVRPIAETAMTSWDNFLNGSKVTGQELESCLASILLGMKQLGRDLEQVIENAPMEEPLARPSSSSGWFDKLRGSSRSNDDGVPAQYRSNVVAHQKWLARACQEIESVKESLDYSLKTVQAFVDQSSTSKSLSGKGLALLEELSQKSSEELSRLSCEWVEWANKANLPEDCSIDQLCKLACEAADYQNILLQRSYLATRCEERAALQSQLETLIRQWWNMIGSDKNVDIKNPAFLVAEARAALRHRDTRRQRVQKIVKDAARHARDESLSLWVHKRKAEIQGLWNDVFSSAGLPPIEITDARVPAVARLGSAIQAMQQLQALKNEVRSVQGDIWSQKQNAAVRLYEVLTAGFSSTDQEAFVGQAIASPVMDDVTATLLLCDSESLASMLTTKGCGSSILIRQDGLRHPPTRPEGSSQQTNAASSRSPRGASGKDRSGSLVGATSETVAKKQQSKALQSGLSEKAEAALKILNPKGR